MPPWKCLVRGFGGCPLSPPLRAESAGPNSGGWTLMLKEAAGESTTNGLWGGRPRGLPGSGHLCRASLRARGAPWWGSPRRGRRKAAEAGRGRTRPTGASGVRAWPALVPPGMESRPPGLGGAGRGPGAGGVPRPGGVGAPLALGVRGHRGRREPAGGVGVARTGGTEMPLAAPDVSPSPAWTRPCSKPPENQRTFQASAKSDRPVPMRDGQD